MVAGHVGVKVFPDPLDPVGVGAVRWQKMKPNTSLILRQCCLRYLAVMNPIVVQDHMDHRSLRMATDHALPQGDKQGAVLALACDPRQQARPDIQRPGPNRLVDPVGEIRRPGRIEAPDEDQVGDTVGEADLAIHGWSFITSRVGRR